MKKIILVFQLTILSVITAFAQPRNNVFKTTEAFILGHYQDSLFEGNYENTIIKLNATTSEMKIIMFNDEIKTNSPVVDSIFKTFPGTFNLELTIDPNSYVDKENVLDNETYSGTVLVTLNGKIQSLPCEYTIHILKTNNPFLKEMKLTFNVIIPATDFDIDIENGLSEEFEIEISHGIINQ